ncbi:ammonium transporter [Hysterangium stoloniferum]|nr:ammonium transporter [Hysterangium stoloniferum]
MSEPTHEVSITSFANRADSSSTFDKGDVGFVIMAGALVGFMIPGLAFLYSGLTRRKSALSLVWVVCASNAIVIFQWFFWGYSLAFSPTAANGFIGDLRHLGLRDVLGEPSPGSPFIPDLLYAFFQMEFAAVTVGILMGGVAERGRVLPAIVFSFFWVTIVYCPLACWAWNINGWAFAWGIMDFAGGGPVEIGSGIGGIAYALALGPRKPTELLNFRPHNVSMVALATWMLWFGWIGFNGGSAFGANMRAIVAAFNSCICAAMGGVTWCLLDFRLEKRWSMVGFCSGTIAGLVAATPSCGYVSPWASIIIGVVAGGVCNYATKLKFLLRIDDALDLFAEHAIGGMIGLISIAIFADKDVVGLDGISTIEAGGFTQNWKRLYKQFAYVCACTGYAFVTTYLLAKGIDLIPGLHLRASDSAENLGMDETEIGEFANDYIEIRRDFLDWNPPMTTRVKESNDVYAKHECTSEIMDSKPDHSATQSSSLNGCNAPQDPLGVFYFEKQQSGGEITTVVNVPG